MLLLALLLQSDAEAKKSLDDFHKAAYKNDAELIAGLRTLARTSHPKVLRELAVHLKTGSDAVRRAAAPLVGAYKDDKFAADELLAAAQTESGRIKTDRTGAEIGYESCLAMLAALTSVAYKPSGAKIVPFFRSRSPAVARAAIAAASEIKNLDAVEPLIALLHEFQSARPSVPQGPNSGRTPSTIPLPNTPLTPNHKPLPPPAAAPNPLESVVRDALRKLTNAPGDLSKAQDWSVWWAKNKAVLKGAEK